MLSKGQPFYGQVDILGAPYLTGYEAYPGKRQGDWRLVCRFQRLIWPG